MATAKLHQFNMLAKLFEYANVLYEPARSMTPPSEPLRGIMDA